MLEMEDQRISKELHSDEQSTDRRCHLQLLCYQQYKLAASVPRLARISSRTKEENVSIYLPSDLMYLAV